jgi:hypothetical protein
MVVLLTGVSIAFLSRTTGDRQVAQSSFHQTKVDVLAQSAMDLVIGDLQQEIANGSTPIPQPDGTTVYMPKDTGSGAAANRLLSTAQMRPARRILSGSVFAQIARLRPVWEAVRPR